MENQKIGNFIKELRKEKNLTQKELADKLLITDRAVSKWERGLSCPDISLLDDLSDILGVSVIELLKGRRLDKDEVINNKELIESMNYANKNMKQKIKKISNLFCTFIICFISLLLIINNVKSFIYTHREYKTEEYNENIYFNDSFMKEYFNKIELIENSQGIYTNEEYQLILTFIKDIKQVSNKKIEQEMILKDMVSLMDLKKFINKIYFYDVWGYEGDSYKNSDLYKIILKYDSDKYDRMLGYNSLKELYRNTLISLDEVFYKAYIYNYKGNMIYDDTVCIFYLYNIINLKYQANDRIITDIIEAGEINE